MNYNYHTHTILCNHAWGTCEEYIKRAIDSGIKYMGFSEHVPFIFPDGSESFYRLHTAEVEVYFFELYRLREKYKDQIEIKIGFEMEYHPIYFDEMLSCAKRYGAEYLILGQHFINQKAGNGDGLYVLLKNCSYDDLSEYVNCIVNGIKSGVFSYVAHPDIFNYIGENEFYNKQMTKLCVASREYNIPLEINFLGIRERRAYPDRRFWEIAGEERCPVIFGFDAHDKNSACDLKSLETAKLLVREYNLKYIGKPRIISI